MIATELHDRITAELDRLDGIEGEATKGEFKVIVADQCRLIALSGTGLQYIMVLADNNADANATLIVASRNRFRPLLAFMRQQADAAINERVVVIPENQEWAMRQLRKKKVKRLLEIAAALGVEVEL